MSHQPGAEVLVRRWKLIAQQFVGQFPDQPVGAIERAERTGHHALRQHGQYLHPVLLAGHPEPVLRDSPERVYLLR
jgi:hypothetical protein